MGREMKSNYQACNVRNESNLYLKGVVKSNTLAVIKISFWAKYYDALSQD